MAAEQTDLIQLIDQLDADISEIRRRSAEEGIDSSRDLERLEAERDRVIETFFSQLSPWDKVRIARHPRRPYTLDYLQNAFDDYLEMHGDRLGNDDMAIAGGLGWIGGFPVVVFGHQKGRDIKERKNRNFGSAKPDGYRKALRMMRLAEKLNKPIVCIVDTPAADCSVEAEQRGISEAIARNLVEMFRIKTPIVVVVIGEGGSGGALGIGVGDKILMLEHAVYSVIPPEGCAAILWRDPNKKVEAAHALKLTAEHAREFGLIDGIIPEPFGGAHRDPDEAAVNLRQAIISALEEVCRQDIDTLLQQRYQKFRAMGVWSDAEPFEQTSTPQGNGRKKKTASSKSVEPAS